MKVFIIADMEGTAGVAAWEQVIPEHEHSEPYRVARRLLTHEINAAAAGAFDAGASTVLVNDCHWRGLNLDMELLDPRVEHIWGFGKTGWSELDGSFDAVFITGIHAMAGTPLANLRHTWSTDGLAELRFNGRAFGEIGLFATGAGDRGVPCVLVTGDQCACAEAERYVPGVVTCQVKTALAPQAARSLSPHSARQKIRYAARRACERAGAIAPVRVTPGPITCEIQVFKQRDPDRPGWMMEREELLSRPSLVKTATADNVPDAFAAAMGTPPEEPSP